MKIWYLHVQVPDFFTLCRHLNIRFWLEWNRLCYADWTDARPLSAPVYFVVVVSYQGAVQSVHPLRKKEEIR
ncbi:MULTISPECIES: hypothetical protein [Paenibacillus]|uniref:hypothetical protein n=1 Tax=Paenibacillus TaxID=44249 RepID=UPI0001E6C044|nr:hypothetical protein [Paenibacillus sp. EKM207P]